MNPDSSPPLTVEAVRLIQLEAQGLLTPPTHPAQKPDVLAAIRRMSALQIDTIHVIARSPYMALWSRLGAYDPAWLDELLAEGALFEYWAHAACFLPIEDYPLYRRLMLNGQRRGWGDEQAWMREHAGVVEEVLGRIRSKGPVRSADFERKEARSSGWWDWKEEKEALEHLFTAGTLMIARRDKFQRVYDLAERVLPGYDDAQTPSREEMLRELAAKAVRCLGVAKAAWAPDYFRLPKRETAAALGELLEQGRLQTVSVQGWDEPALVHPDNLPLLEAARAGCLQATYTTLLSPFDPLVWDRARARDLFGFDFSIECYLPAARRRYGYYLLPILHQGRLVGRLDAKAHRKEGIFEVKALYLEPEDEPTPGLAAALRDAIQRCADWHETPEVQVTKTEPEGFMNLRRFVDVAVGIPAYRRPTCSAPLARTRRFAFRLR